MKEKYITPVIETEELAKADVLCGSFDNMDNSTDDGNGVFSLDGNPIVFNDVPMG